ncbi:MAG: sodium:proton antiporter [Gammaproteobacteria bacterium]|nr:sodium:proton antiporter [Gammaproteobacteria bacterium]
MNFFTIVSIFLTFTVILLGLNHYFKKPMQANIFLVLGSLFFCLIYRYILNSGLLNLGPHDFTILVKSIDFPNVLINGILSYLLFAGALHCDLNIIKKLKFTIIPLALLGTLISTFIIGCLMYFILQLFDYHFSFLLCLIFGALISPTDPIAVLSMLKELGAAKFLKETLAGESLFNDGVGIVIFITLVGILNGQSTTLSSIIYLFCQLTFGGLIYGYIVGKVGIKLINLVEQDNEFTLILTLWITTTGYVIAEFLGVSGPLAMVMSGLLIGNKIDNWRTRQQLFAFWDTIDNSLNCFLFLLIGLEILILEIPYTLSFLILLTIIVSVIARAMSVYASLYLFKSYNAKTLPLWSIISWGGLRGGLAIALVLSLPNNIDHQLLIILTYAIVLFSIIIQGLTIKPLLERVVTLLEVDTRLTKN